MFRGNQKKWGNIYFYGYGSVLVDLFRSCRFAYVPPNSYSYKFSRIDGKIPASKSFFDKVLKSCRTPSVVAFVCLPRIKKLHNFKVKVTFGNQNKTLIEKVATSRGVFRTLQNNYNGAFLWKYYRLQVVNYFSKKPLSQKFHLAKMSWRFLKLSF